MLDLKSLVVLGVYFYVILRVLKKGERTKKALATVIALYFLMGPEGFGTDEASTASLGTATETATETGAATETSGTALEKAADTIGSAIKNFQDVSNINTDTVGKSSLDERGGGMMGPKSPAPGSQMPYDGLLFETGNNQSWMKSPDNTSLLPDDTLYTYLGSTGPIKMKISDQSALIGPPVDGVEGSPEKMFMLANNRSSLSCCPSTFSTSTGCICSTENQRDYVAERGGNN